ncbi:MAG: hypothetical protein AB7J47_23375 [Acidimicrobiia bacterium]
MRRSSTHLVTRLAALGALGLLASGVAACGTADNRSVSSPAAAPAQQATTTATATTVASASTLPGESIDNGPAAGAVLAVVGVPFDDVLEVRSAPGDDQDVVTSLEPLADDVVATGRARLLASSGWFEVTANGTTGWANAAFLAYLGDTTDTTSAVVAALGGIPTATSMLELGGIVAGTAASVDEPSSRVTVAVAPSERADLGEVTYDVVGLPDDSIYGVRLQVFGTPTDADLPRSALLRATTFALKTVETTTLCRRGVTDDRLCI